MSYCSINDKPRVIYKFANISERVFESKVAPLDIEIVDLPNHSGGQCTCVKYRVTYSYTNSLGVRRLTARMWGEIGRLFVDSKIDKNNNYSILLACRGSGEVQSCQPEIGNYGVSGYQATLGLPQNLIIESIVPDDIGVLDNCGEPPAKVRINIIYDGKVIFTDVGNYPGSFKVACSAELCPPETCCECDCGAVICCYGNQGQVLKTIRK